jgi:hypothetical protein
VQTRIGRRADKLISTNLFPRAQHGACGCSMGDDEYKALRWLLGRGTRTETVRTIDGRRIEQHIGEADARNALIRLLRSSSPLTHDIRNALGNAFGQLAVLKCGWNSFWCAARAEEGRERMSLALSKNFRTQTKSMPK